MYNSVQGLELARGARVVVARGLGHGAVRPCPRHRSRGACGRVLVAWGPCTVLVTARGLSGHVLVLIAAQGPLPGRRLRGHVLITARGPCGRGIAAAVSQEA